MRDSKNIVATLMLATYMLGCGDSETDGTTIVHDSTINCGKANTTAVAPDEETKVGTPQSAVDWLNGQQTMELKWWAYTDDNMNMQTTAMDSEVTLKVDNAKWVTYEKESAVCADRLSLKGFVSVQSMDGVFREQFPATASVLVDTPETAQIEGILELADVKGIYDFTSLAGEYNKPIVRLEAKATPQLQAGKIVVTGKNESDPTNNSTLVAEF